MVDLLVKPYLMAHVSEVGMARLDATHCLHCLIHCPMGRVRIPAQRVKNQCINAFQFFPVIVGYSCAVGDVSKRTYAVAEDREFAVKDPDWHYLIVSDLNHVGRGDAMQINGRNAWIAMHEDVVVVLDESLGNAVFGIGVERIAETVGAKVVESGAMVEMDMCDEQGIELLDVGSQSLLAEVGTAVNEDVLVIVGLYEYAGAKSVVTWISRFAHRTLACWHWHTAACACA